MKILALIPARKGSKRLPNKNIKLLGSKPLIQWSIDIAKNIENICDILISTDSEEIIQIANDCNVLAPWLRPSNLATDYSTSIDVTLHAIQWYQENVSSIDAVLLLQPTSPFRFQEDMERGIELFKTNSNTSIIGVSEAKNHPLWTFKIDNDLLIPYIDKTGLKMRSQELPKAYTINGSFYLISPKNLEIHKSFFLANSIALISNHEETNIDIDTMEDWNKAEYYLNSGKFF